MVQRCCFSRLEPKAEPKVDQISDVKTIDYRLDIEITDKQTLHPREQLKRKFISKIEDKDLKFIKQVPQHTHDRLSQKTEKE